MIPGYIRLGGPKTEAAYRRAMKNGATYDRRFKVSVVGQDRVGKTSLCKALRGLLFDRNEPSTNGVVLSDPVANAGTTPWNSLQPDFVDHKITAEVASELRSTLDGQPTRQNETEESRRKTSEKNSQVATENGRFYD